MSYPEGVPYKIYKVTTNLYRKGLSVAAAEEVIYDDQIEPEDVKDFYEPSEYERAVTIPEQIDLLSSKVIQVLNDTNQYGKTIIFCVDMAHAQAVKDKINELKGREDYAARIVAEDKDDLTVFRDKERPMPVVATTVDLLSTGVDIPHIQNIVFMRPIASRVLFKQIMGRGSRLFEGKGFFRIIDFTNATRLIDEWDIPPEPPKPPTPPEESETVSNLSLRDKKVSVYHTELYSLIANGLLTAKSQSGSIEPEKILTNKYETEAFASVRTTLLRQLDAFGTINWRQVAQELQWLGTSLPRLQGTY